MMDDSRDPAHLLELVALISQSVRVVLDQKTSPRPHSTVGSDALSPADAPGDVRSSYREAVKIIEGACAQLCASVAPAAHTMVNHAFDMITPVCIRLALEARVAEHLRDGPKSAIELGELTGIDAGKLARVLRHLALRLCFHEVRRDVFENTKLSACLLPEDTTSAFIWLFVDQFYHAYDRLADVLLDPESTSAADRAHSAYFRANGCQFFDHTEMEPLRCARFAKAMQGQTKVNGGHVLLVDSYLWGALTPGATFCDVGGGIGDGALALLSAHSHMKAVVQDQPGTIRRAQLFWNSSAPAEIASGRARLVPIDFFTEPPTPGCAVYYLKHILCAVSHKMHPGGGAYHASGAYLAVHSHDWPDNDCVVILRNVRAAMTAPHARVLIHEIVLGFQVSEAPFPLPANYGIGGQYAYNMDMNMMCALNSRERTLDEFISLGKQAELKYVKTWDGGQLKMVEFEAA